MSVLIISGKQLIFDNLKLKVTAEGVETKEQLDYLIKQQCDEMQGYLCSKPMPTQEFENLLARYCRAESEKTVGLDYPWGEKI